MRKKDLRGGGDIVGNIFYEDESCEQEEDSEGENEYDCDEKAQKIISNCDNILRDIKMDIWRFEKNFCSSNKKKDNRSYLKMFDPFESPPAAQN